MKVSEEVYCLGELTPQSLRHVIRLIFFRLIKF